MSGWDHLPVDLSDADAAVDGLRLAADTTRLAFAAYVEHADLAEQIAPNVALLENTLDALDRLDAPLRHVTLYQGMKYYGAHLGRFRTPAKEDDPRLMVPNFYYDQEDLLRERAASQGFAMTVLRPEAVIGYAQGTPMNLLMAIGTYVSMTKELGLPLRFPGARTTYDGIFYQMTDAELLARATDWAGTTPRCGRRGVQRHERRRGALEPPVRAPGRPPRPRPRRAAVDGTRTGHALPRGPVAADGGAARARRHALRRPRRLAVRRHDPELDVGQRLLPHQDPAGRVRGSATTRRTGSWSSSTTWGGAGSCPCRPSERTPRSSSGAILR
ncbi:hypothetical protein DEJ15_16320 [Curtobacterium sp. MCJR17_043]|nr:hypothetical protein [Curtobacterium sp. MCJR17_043]WIB35685.1 hypothetical protein DEJ15_16320 [Curtobacterium sp. MCJR17_043]